MSLIHKKTLVENWTLYLGVLFFIYVGFLSWFFYIEKTTSFDSAAFAFDIIRTKDFALPLNRWGSAFSQILPILFLKNGASLELVLKAYSLSFALLNFILFLIINIGLKNKKVSVIFLLTICLSVRNTFYFSVSEFSQGLSLVVLVYALLQHLNAQQNIIKKILFFIIISLISSSLFYYNQLLIVPLVFVFIYFVVENNIYRNPYIYVDFLSTISWFGIKLLMLPKNGYEKTKIPTTDVFFNQISNFFELPSWEYLVYFFGREFYLLPLLFLVGLILLVYKRKFLLALLCVGFTISYVVLITITYYRGETPYMYEQYFIVFGLIIALIASSAFINIEKLKSISIVLLLLAFGGYGLYSAHVYPTKRVDYIKLLAKEGNKYTNKKFIIHPDDFPWGYGWATWAFPLETILISSIESNNNSITCYIPDVGEKVDISSNSELLSIDWMKHILNVAALDTHYFKMPLNSNYLITNRIDKNISFVKETIRYSRLWLINIEKQADERNITLEENILNSAQYVIDTKPPSQKIDFIIRGKDLELIKKENEIKSSDAWMEIIKQKAKERGVSAENMVTLDAQYLLSQEKK